MLCVICLTESDAETVFETDEYESASNTNIPILILTENKDCSQLIKNLSFGTNKINITNKIPTTITEKAIIIDQSWIDKNNKNLIDSRIVDLINDLKIVTILESSTTFYDNSNLIFVAFADNADTYSIYKRSETSGYTCHSVSDRNYNESLISTYCWYNSQLNSEPAPNNILNNPWGTEYTSSGDFHHNGYGHMDIDTDYFVLEEDNAQYNYYYAQCKQSSIPDNNRYTADMHAINTNLQENLKYKWHEPTTTPGESSVTVGFNSDMSTQLGLEPGVSFGVGFNVSWTYSIADIVVNDRSQHSRGYGYLDVWHNVNEDKNVGKYSITVMPGKFMKVDCDMNQGQGYCAQVDKYTIQFCKKNALGIKTYSTMEEQLRVLFRGLPHTVSVNSNGADGSIYEYEDPNAFRPIVTDTYSEGSHFTVKNYDWYKNGYTFAGYSTNANSSVADYTIGQKVKILNDVTYYAVWIPDNSQLQT